MGHQNDKRPRKKSQENIEKVPDYLKKFVDSITIKPDEAEIKPYKPRKSKAKNSEDENDPKLKLTKKVIMSNLPRILSAFVIV